MSTLTFIPGHSHHSRTNYEAEAPASYKIRAGPAGLHVFNRVTGLNILLDELSTPPNSWARAPRQTSIALTNACDLACEYCYAPKHRAALDPDSLMRWLHELDANGCLGIGFGGGEPTLYPYFAEMCRHAASKTGMAVTFTTHAHRIDGTLAAKLKGSVHFIRVSMDGIESTYEDLRARPFVALKSRLEIIRGLAPFGINYVVNARTFPDLDRAIDFVGNIGASEFLLLPEQKVHGTGGIDQTTLRSLRDWVWRYRGPVPLTISEASAHGMPACSPVAGETGLAAYAHVDATARVSRSSYDPHGVLIGTGGIMEALHRLEIQDQEVPQ